MIDKFETLCRVKGLHEQSKRRALREKRAAAEVAITNENAQHHLVAESRAELPRKEDTLYDAILHVAVSIDDIDETKAKVLSLQEEHEKQEDEAERLTQVRMRCETERDSARVQYEMAQRTLERFGAIRMDLATQRRLALEAKEEAEIDELLLGRGRGVWT